MWEQMKNLDEKRRICDQMKKPIGKKQSKGKIKGKIK
jgi:hypothetical protein